MQDINDIIKANTGLVYKQLHKFYLSDDPDAESYAYEALMNAALTFDEATGVKFSTYATVCIYNALGCHIRRINKKRQLEVMSYNTTAYSDENGEHEHLEYIASEAYVDENLMRVELVETTRKEIKNIVDETQNDTHRKIMFMYIESEYEATTYEIALKTGVSQSYVSQILNIFKGKLRKRMEEYYNA